MYLWLKELEMLNIHTVNSYYKPCTSSHGYYLKSAGIESVYVNHRIGERGVDWDQSDLVVDDSPNNRNVALKEKEEDTSFRTKGDVLREIDGMKDFYLSHVVDNDYLIKNLNTLVEYADENDAWEDRVYGEPNSLVMELVQTMYAFGLPEVRDMGKLYEFSKQWFKDNRDKALRAAAPYVALGNELKEILRED